VPVVGGLWPGKDLLDKVYDSITTVAQPSFDLKFDGWFSMVTPNRSVRMGVTNGHKTNDFALESTTLANKIAGSQNILNSRGSNR
jgi:hypothetical protein